MSRDDEKMVISLTGVKSHTVKIPLGQGSFAIGSIGMPSKYFDVLVDENLPIQWNAFDEFYTGAGSHWPRFFYYSGNDIGFIEWSKKRPIEDFSWCPSKPAFIDLTNAQINHFIVRVGDSKLQLAVGDNMRSLTISGKLENIELVSVAKMPRISLIPSTEEANPTPYKIPLFKKLEQVASIDISFSPLEQALDCESLLQFPNLLHLSLSGNLANLSSLEKLEQLETLAIRYSPHLENLPPLGVWKRLRSFIGWNIEEATGKRLRAEIKQLEKEREMSHSSVSKLRKKVWFTTEYGIPFSSWDDKLAKSATKAYKAVLKIILKAKSESDVKDAIVAFVNAINALPNIETSEREDAGTAVQQLVEASPVKVDEKTANAWFDENRDF